MPKFKRLNLSVSAEADMRLRLHAMMTGTSPSEVVEKLVMSLDKYDVVDKRRVKVRAK